MALATELATARETAPEAPRFGLATATFVVVSSMIGTGVLTTSGFTVYFVGSNQLMLALWAVGGVLALCGALTLCELSADGSIQGISFDVPIKKSSWVAMRVYPSSHTNPVFITVGGKPIRASKKSAEWCLKSVDQCWSKKESAIRPAEKEEARKAYEVARDAYRKILAESNGD